MDQSNRELVDQYLQVWNTNGTELLQAITADNFKWVENSEVAINSPSELMKTSDTWHTAIPDFKIESGKMVVQDNQAFYYCTSEGTNTGNFGKLPPTGKSSKTNGFDVLTFNDQGKIVREESFYDLLGVYQVWGYTINPPSIE